jgi:diacylglycerol kinase family enzyme
MATLTSIHGGRRGERVAVLLNANARSVNDKLRREIARFLPEQDVFYSHTLSDAQAIARTVLDRGYTTLLTGGGDGTFVGYVNAVMDELASRPQGFSHGNAALKLQPEPAPLPRFGILRLGTGNALAELVGASPKTVGVVEDILRARTGDVRQTRSLHLLHAGGKRTPFAGLGLDARVLNDYVAVKKALKPTPLKALGEGGMGYFMSVAGLSVPAMTLQSAPQVTITNLGGPAQQVAPDGRPAGRPIETGEVLYQGPARFAAAGTAPYYGYGFTVFPHALRSPGRMHLRVTAMTVPEILRNLGAIWKGRTPAGMLDFHVDKVAMRFDRPMPFQIGGDAEGYHREVVLEMDPRPIELLDFKAMA